ncbi:hypothetical protein [Sphingomonas cavernae]|uniref:Uncharacterized protein n=1 Tax=Sphingomonas cavernae TaxID=2320861 RepID=A0A418WJX4_9SPHN|nr:hypothetical protein [Sphingomonas cavernae]RJF90337.1 hypothetical protein D3876_08755 [Sphingomonas cavernae]
MSTFSKILESFDGSDELAQAEREALDALAGLADAKRELFTKQINLLILDAGTGTNKTVPISSVLRTDGLSRAYSSSSAKDIGDVLKTALGGFIEGGVDNILDGIFSILTRTLEIFLGSTEGEELTKAEYFVYSTEFAIYRVDLMAWSRTVTAVSLKSKIEQSTAFSYVISNVDIERIKWIDFVAIYTLQLKNIESLTPEERAAAKQRMTDTWNFLKGPDVEAAALEAAPNFARVEAEYQIPLVSYR